MASATALLLAALLGSATLKLLIVAVALLGFAGWGWFRILDAAERTLLLLLIRRRQGDTG